MQKPQWTNIERSSKRFQCGNLDEVKSKKEVIPEAQREKKKVHFATLMDICHLKSAELEPKHQKYKGRAVFRGDIVKDDSGAYAVVTEQGSSASQMTAAKSHGRHCETNRMRRTSSRRSICFLPVKSEDAPRLLEIPKSECPDIWIRLPRHKWPKSWSSMEDPVVPLERNLHGHPVAGFLWERQFEEVLLGLGWEQSTKLGMTLCPSDKKGLFSSENVGDIKNGWKEAEYGSHVEEVDGTC